ncbi:MAG: 50S ribosomal protein L30 [Candidatus Aenigmarchaeota archaeon]|nr:50S ribosomal protein L30 [Candidatus Aenigmarchaeota archaeon]
MIAIIRIRGTIGIRKDIKETLAYLKLNKPNHCVIVPENEIYLGMIKKVKDYIAYGKINDKTLKAMIETRGKYSFSKPVEKKDVEKVLKLVKEGKIKESKIKNLFMLQPPKKGFKRSTKKGFNQKGILGDNKEKINDLLSRML